MSQSIRLVLAVHNHQPVGNFEGVFEQAYQDSYLPFLDVLDKFPTIPLTLHVSGSLMEWIEEHHPDYLDRLQKMLEEGRLELLGGTRYEAILPMLPQHDRIGQIESYTHWLQHRLGAEVRGMWIPERVWEPGLVKDLVDAGIEYTLLDDWHFRCAGFEDSQLYNYYICEDEGRLLKIFPDSERLRYTIPFADPIETVDYLKGIAEEHPGAVMVFGDDGEKFGVWPETHKHVYEDRWLARFFELLVANEDWINLVTLSEAVDSVPPQGKAYLPTASYREMMEWAMPAPRQIEYEDARRNLKHAGQWDQISQFVRGGFWRNFKVKYPETDEMYTRMLQVSKRLQELKPREGDVLLHDARAELYRGQCNCSYWHGAFGGLYLPHLRNAVYQNLIAADNLIEQAQRPKQSWVEIDAGDYNLDARQEVKISNDKLFGLVAPTQGGMLYELDVRAICLNLLATLTRREESYHRRVLAGANYQEDPDAVSIHDRAVFKDKDLDQKLVYDPNPRKSLIDHFYDNEICHGTVARCEAMERGDFSRGIYEAVLRRGADHVQLSLSRNGNAWGHPLSLRKNITAAAGSSTLRIDYELEGLPKDKPFHLAVEFNFAGLPAGADDRYFFQNGEHLGQLGTELDLHDATGLGLRDEWLGIEVELLLSRPSGLWTFPVETVSLSEAGFELVHQSVTVQPHWLVQGDAEGRWSVSMELKIDTSLAEERQGNGSLEATLSEPVESPSAVNR